MDKVMDQMKEEIESGLPDEHVDAFIASQLCQSVVEKDNPPQCTEGGSQPTKEMKQQLK